MKSLLISSQFKIFYYFLYIVMATVFITILTVKLSTVAYAQNACPAGLASYWNMEETSGNIKDLTGDNHLAVSSAFTHAVAGKISKSIQNNTGISGLSCMVESCVQTMEPLVENGITATTWVFPTAYPTGNVQQDIMKKGTAATGWGMFLNSAGQIRAEMGNQGCTNDAGFGYHSNLPLNQWSFLAMTVSPGNPGVLKLYKNGQLIFQSPQTAYYCPTDNAYHMGSINGKIDDSGKWNRELSASEIASLYNNGAGKQCFDQDYCRTNSDCTPPAVCQLFCPVQSESCSAVGGSCVIPPDPPCEGFSRSCTDANGEVGSQFCKPGILNKQNQCIAKPGVTQCFKTPTSNEPGCFIPDCSATMPGLAVIPEYGPGGMPIYATPDYRGARYKVLIDNTTDFLVNTPSYTKFPENAPDLIFEQAVDLSGNFFVVIPDNNSLTDNHEYTVTASHENGATCGVPFIIRVPKRQNLECPTGYTSTQAKIRLGSADPWTINGTMSVGETITIAGFHNNVNTVADDVMLTILGPEGDLASVETISPSGVYTPSLPGTYIVTAQVPYTVDQKCMGTARLTVRPAAIYTVSYKIAETPEGLDAASPRPYTKEPIIVDWKFSDTTPGQKFIWVEYTSSDGKTERHNLPINFVGDDAFLTSVICTPDLGRNGLTVELTGGNFGIEEGSVTLNEGEKLKIRNWTNNSITAHLDSLPSTFNPSEGIQNDITLERKDGQRITAQCNGTSQLSLGADVFCRSKSLVATPNVQAVISENKVGGKQVRRIVSVDVEGVVNGLTDVLRSGQEYQIALKPPRGIRKITSFVATDGTTILPEFFLPMGDIAPLPRSDGKINTLDHDQMVREWSAATETEKERSADLFVDSKVNSVDWACMRYDFNEQDSLEFDPKFLQSSNANAPAETLNLATDSGIQSEPGQ
jgi:hypothetical protein